MTDTQTLTKFRLHWSFLDTAHRDPMTSDLFSTSPKQAERILRGLHKPRDIKINKIKVVRSND